MSAADQPVWSQQQQDGYQQAYRDAQAAQDAAVIARNRATVLGPITPKPKPAPKAGGKRGK